MPLTALLLLLLLLLLPRGKERSTPTTTTRAVFEPIGRKRRRKKNRSRRSIHATRKLVATRRETHDRPGGAEVGPGADAANAGRTHTHARTVTRRATADAKRALLVHAYPTTTTTTSPPGRTGHTILARVWCCHENQKNRNLLNPDGRSGSAAPLLPWYEYYRQTTLPCLTYHANAGWSIERERGRAGQGTSIRAAMSCPRPSLESGSGDFTYLTYATHS